MDNWTLKPCESINRILRIRTDTGSIDRSLYPTLVTIRHKYTTADDLLFPHPSTLGFFSGFEQACLEKLDGAIFVAQDIDTGLLKLHIYTADHHKTIMDTIEHLKLRPEYHVEFEVMEDREWKVFEGLENG